MMTDNTPKVLSYMSYSKETCLLLLTQHFPTWFNHTNHLFFVTKHLLTILFEYPHENSDLIQLPPTKAQTKPCGIL